MSINSGFSGGGGAIRRVYWAFQDFLAGTINSTTVTITENINGITEGFRIEDILGNSAILVAQNEIEYIYSGSTKLFSQLVKVVSHNENTITLNAIPHVNWGIVRVYYQVFYDVTPENYQLPKNFVSTQILATLDDQFITDIEFDSHHTDFFNPHSVTKTQIGLSNVSNVDTTNAINITSGTNNAFNRNFGTTSSTICVGNDSRLSNPRVCNNVFSDPSTAKNNIGLPNVPNIDTRNASNITINTNNAFNKSFGTTPSTICVGNDSRLSDARVCNGYFTSPTTAKTQIGLSNVSNVDTRNAGNITSGTLSNTRLNSTVTLKGNVFNSANNLLLLDGSGKIPVLDGSNITNLASAPSGMILWFAANTAPAGYFICNGSILSNTTYASLFSVIGYTFGSSGSSFYLPNLTGSKRFIRAGTSVGANESQNIQSHQHTLPFWQNLNDDGYNSSVQFGQDSSELADDSMGEHYASNNQAEGGEQAVLSKAYGSGETRPINMTLLPIIKY